MSKRFVARAELAIAEVLSQLGEPTTAVADGRVFRGRRRVTGPTERVAIGEEVLVHAAPAEIALPEPFILHHGDGVLVVNKPAGISTVPDTSTSRGTLIDLAARAVGRTGLHATSRLDREVSGAVTFALDERARDALAEAREHGRYERRYVALAAGELQAGPWLWPIGRARDPKLRRVGGDGKPSETRVKVVARSGQYALLALAPITGRTHQIRVHAAAAGAPLLGDRAYGGASRLTLPTGKSVTVGRVALHCAFVRIETNGCIILATSPVPPELLSLARDVGLPDFEEAMTCAV